MPIPVVTLSPNGGTPLVITEPVYSFQEAPDWGVAETNVDLVEGTEIQGAVAGTRTQVVKQMILALMIDSDTGADYIASAQALDLAATQLARDGGTVTHQILFDDDSLSEALEVEILSCSIDADAEWTHHRIGLVTLNLVAQPQWLAPEEEVAQVLNSTASLVELAIPALRGNLHGPGRVVIKDRSSQRRRFVELGAAFSEYDAAAEYEYRAAAFSLTGADGSLVTTAVTGRIGPDTISVLPLLPVWRTVGFLNDLPLKGNFRVRVRSLCESEEVTVLQRVLWREGTNGAWRELETVEVPAGGFYDQDTGSIPNYSEAATIDIRVDVRSALGIEASAPYRLNVLTATPTDIYAVVRGLSVPVPAAGIGAYDASADVADATALDATRAPLIGGSNWAVAGSATKFTADGGIWRRTGVADASPGVGHHALLSPTAVTNTTVALTASLTYLNAAKQTRAMIGALVRYVDASNYAAAVIQVRRRNDGAYEPYLSFVKRVAGTLTYLKTKEAKKTNLAVNGLGYGAPGGFAISGAISVSVKADGSYEVSTGPNFSDLEATELALSGSDAVLATAGALASGKPGVYSSSEDVDGVAQWYQIAAYADADASTLIDVVRSAGTGEIRHDQTYSADADGDDPQPVSSHQGRRPWLPPSTAGVITAKVRRDDSEAEPDTYDAADAVDLTVYQRPAFATLSDALYEAPPEPPTYSELILADAPYFYSRMGDASSTQQDETAGNHDVTLTGATHSATGALAGDADKAVSFDGTDDYGSVALDLSDTNVVTVEMWVYRNAWVSGARSMVEFSSPNFTAGGFLLDQEAAAAGYFGFGAGGAAKCLHEYNPATVIPAGQWTHIALVMDKSLIDAARLKLYANGAVVTATPIVNSADTSNFANSTLYLMSRIGTSQFQGGLVDEVAVYKTALSAAQVLAHYEAGI